MREISLYQGNERYVLDYKKDIDELNKKLVDDYKLLLQIKKDYEINNKEFEFEFLKADYIYHLNLRIYNVFILNDFFSRVIIESFNTDIDEMKKRGWLLFYTDYSLTSFNNISIEQKYINFFSSIFDTMFNYKITEKNTIINQFYEEAIFNYKNQKYYSCVCALFPIIENIHQRLTEFDGKTIYSIKQNLDKLTEKVIKINQPFKTHFDFYIKLVEQMNDLIENHYFKKSLLTDEEPEIICRNRISHGIFTRNISQKDCLQLFCTIFSMNSLLTLFNADKTINRLQPLINQKEKKLKELLNI